MAEEQNPDAAGMDDDLADEWAAAMSESGDANDGEELEDEWAAAMSEQKLSQLS